MSINLDESNEDAQIARFKEDLRQMSDADVIRYGKAARRMARYRDISASNWKQHAMSGAGGTRQSSDAK